MSNLELYNKVRSVPVEAQKEIKAGRLKGMTDINPQWRIKTLTDQFGICGFGWYIDIEKEWLETGANDEITANVEIKLYIKQDNEWSKGIVGIGGSKLVTKESNGLYTSDECFKMALTDAISVACKQLGFGADIYYAADRTKYSDDMTAKSAPQTTKNTNLNTNNPSKPQTSPDTAKNEPKQEVDLETAKNTTLNFGKYKGTPLQMVDTDYLHWLVKNSNDEFIRKCAKLVIAWENDKIPEVAVPPVDDDGLPF